LMQHFREAGLQPSAFSGRENHNGNIFVRHGSSILLWSGPFDNAAFCLLIL